MNSYSNRLENAITEAKKLETLMAEFKLKSVCKDIEYINQYEKDADNIRWGILRLQASLGSFKIQMTPENLRKEEIIYNYLESKISNKIDTIQSEMSDYVDTMREQEVEECVCNNIKDFQKDIKDVCDLLTEFFELKDEIIEIKDKLKVSNE